MTADNLSTLISFIKEAADSLQTQETLSEKLSPSIEETLLNEAIVESLKESVNDPSIFEELVIINLITKAFLQGNSAEEIREMIFSLGEDEE